MEWIIVGRPGYLGKHREERYQEWNEKYGKGNWRLVWKVGKIFVDFLGACALYEDAYIEFLRNNPKVLLTLINEASNVYDDGPSNVESGFDFTKQETIHTHLQDIAIRRSLLRLGLWFMGKELIRIRQERGTHPLSMILSPGRIPFHRPDLIVQPEIIKWWHPETVESFYQSNRFLQVKEGAIKNKTKIKKGEGKMSQKKAKKNPWEKPKLLFGNKEEDRKACHLIMASGMPCEFLATKDENTPYLLHHLIEYRRLKEIKEFVERWKEWKKEQSK